VILPAKISLESAAAAALTETFAEGLHPHEDHFRRDGSVSARQLLRMQSDIQDLRFVFFFFFFFLFTFMRCRPDGRRPERCPYRAAADELIALAVTGCL